MELPPINTKTKGSIIDSFQSIANDLISNKQILINGSRFSFIDIEFYYWNEMHQDGYTLEHTRPKGEFEIHGYGIDISLGNSTNEFGGILIRGLYYENNDKVIRKPDVVKSIYNNFKLGENHFEINNKKTRWTGTFKTKRLNLGDAGNDNKKEFANSQYRYLAKNEIIFAGYPNKEAIFRHADLNDAEVERLLGYKLPR